MALQYVGMLISLHFAMCGAVAAAEMHTWLPGVSPAAFVLHTCSTASHSLLPGCVARVVEVVVLTIWLTALHVGLFLFRTWDLWGCALWPCLLVEGSQQHVWYMLNTKQATVSPIQTKERMYEPAGCNLRTIVHRLLCKNANTFVRFPFTHSSTPCTVAAVHRKVQIYSRVETTT